MPVGVFFGSFDPPHIGHTNVIVGALNSGKVDKVLVIPAYQNVWKESTPFAKRVVMAQLAFGDIEDVYVSSIEERLRQENPNKYPIGVPTCDVLAAINDNPIIITTPETYSEIPKWENGELILKKYEFLLVISSNDEIPSRDILQSVSNCYIPGITICSTCIRNRVKNGVRIEPFVTDDVIQCINKFKIYV